MLKLLPLVRNWSPGQWMPRGKLAQSSLVVMAWQAVRLLMLAAWVIVAARALGPNGYGAFAGIAGLATVLAGFSGLGIGLLMYQRVAIAPTEFGYRWRQTVAATLASGLALALVFVPISQLSIVLVDWEIVTLIAASEIFLFPLVGMSAFAFAAHDNMGWAAALPTISAMLRLMAMLFFLDFAPTQDLGHYLWYHLVASAAGSLISLICVHRVLRPSRATLSIGKSDFAEGLAFAAVWFTGNAMSSLDKSLVLRIGGSTMSGLYASAYRFASVFVMPIDALVMSAMPRLFRAGAGCDTHPRLISYLCLATVIYGVMVGGILWLVAGYLPWLLGAQFAEAVPALRWMCLFIPLYGMRQLGSQLLVAEGRKVSRAAIEICALVFMVLLAHVLIPAWGLTGAVAMLLLTEGLLALVVWRAALLSGRSRSKS